MTGRRPRILFGEHATQVPAIRRHLDADRFDATYGVLNTLDPLAFDLVVPLRIGEIDVARRANSDGRRRTVQPDAALVELCDDKLAGNEWLIAHGFGAHVPTLLGDAPTTYPYVRKGRRGDFGTTTRMVRAPGDDAAIADSFCQRAVAGADEYVLHLLRIGGEVRFHLAYRYAMGDPLAIRGHAARPRTITLTDAGDALGICTAILDAMGYEGTCCVNYKLADGIPQILEINPRFGGSLVGEVTAYVAAYLAAI